VEGREITGNAIPWEIWTVLLPLSAAMLSFLLGGRASFIVVPAAAISTLAAVSEAVRQVWVHGPRLHRIGGWEPPLGIELYADGLSVSMLLLAAVVISAASLYTLELIHRGKEYFEGCDHPLFWPLWLFLWAAVNAVFLSRDIFNLYITMELLVLCAVPLLTLAGSGSALRAGMRYLLVAMLGSMCYLLGVVLLYGSYSTLSIPQLEAVMKPGPVAWTSIVLITLGLLLKTALFPLHFWLPSAHGNAPAPVSAILSGLVIKASFYVLMRFWFGPFSAILPLASGHYLGILGSGAILWGSLLALRQERLKLLIAYSTVAQVGYFFLLFPLATLSRNSLVPDFRWEGEAWSGAVFFMISHGLAKASMFLAAGCIARAAGSDRIKDMAGMAHRLPVSVFAFALAGAGIMGLPPSGGFIGKWMLLKAAFGSGQWWWALVMNAGGLLAAGYIFVVLRQMLLSRVVTPTVHPVAWGMQWTALFLALLSITLGVSGSLPFDLLEIGSPFEADRIAGGV
jgi:formate hydrogenlyase subunit 3/multisubunit Na+/H+ antiporter MnhD subunit